MTTGCAALPRLRPGATAPADDGCLPGFRLDGGGGCPVPPSALRAVHRPPGWLPAGLASGPTWAAGWSAAGALRDGLELATLAYRSAASGEPEYAPPPDRDPVLRPVLPYASRSGALV
jgi:hypothetical protein